MANVTNVSKSSSVAVNSTSLSSPPAEVKETARKVEGLFVPTAHGLFNIAHLHFISPCTLSYTERSWDGTCYSWDYPAIKLTYASGNTEALIYRFGRKYNNQQLRDEDFAVIMRHMNIAAGPVHDSVRSKSR